MSDPKEPDDVKLISSLFSPQASLIQKALEELVQVFGPTDWIGPEIFFDRTRYYEREMGWPLHRRFVSFRDLIRPEDIVSIKLKTNVVEKKHAEDHKRRINIDPGYITLERLILATGKNYIHRIYLSKGIYADLTLVFHRGTFKPLEWTYKDYAHPDMIACFNEIRERYRKEIRGLA